MRLFYEVQRRYEPVAKPPATKIVRNSLPYDTEFSDHALAVRTARLPQRRRSEGAPRVARARSERERHGAQGGVASVLEPVQ